MAFRLEYYPNELIDTAIQEAISEYNNFYGINVTNSTIRVNIIKDRETLDQIEGQKTENWMRGYARGTHIYLLDIDTMEETTQGLHKKNISQYKNMIKHEIAHSFYWLYLNGKYLRIQRLQEGMSIYLSGQLTEKTKPEKFESFLDFWDKEGKAIYHEAGFVIELLIHKYGKDRLLELVKSAGQISNKEEFFEKFKEIFGFELSYENLNTELK